MSPAIAGNRVVSVDETTRSRRHDRISCFDVSLMPSESIRKRELHSFSVHYSVATAKWIATLARPTEQVSSNPADACKKIRCLSFPFATEREARKFAQGYTPPKMMAGATNCVCCSMVFSSSTNVTKSGPFNCRNCGAQVCGKCSARWGARMIPKTYLVHHNSALTVRVCKSCNWLSNAFCMALLYGNYEDALRLHATGNVNLRCTFADIHKEAMFPIHCAVMGGNLKLVKWLVETQGCPISVRRDPKSGMLLSVQTSSSRTLMDLAMTGKPKTDILSYLVKQNLSVMDTKDLSSAPKTLQALLCAGFNAEMDDGRRLDTDSFQGGDPSDASIGTLEDACVICCERQMDCVLTPCGHQVCCSDCGAKLGSCPVCKRPATVLRIFRL